MRPFLSSSVCVRWISVTMLWGFRVQDFGFPNFVSVWLRFPAKACLCVVFPANGWIVISFIDQSWSETGLQSTQNVTVTWYWFIVSHYCFTDNSEEQCFRFSDCASCTANTHGCQWCEDRKCISASSNCTVVSRLTSKNQRNIDICWNWSTGIM